MAVQIILLTAVLQFTFIAGLPETKTPFYETINYNTTHFKTGDSMPPRNAKLRLYGMRFCPYTEKVVLVLNAKNLDYDMVLINLQHKPDWFVEINGKRAVPVLEIEGGKAISDSNIINVYLDEQYPEVPLQGVDPLKRAQDKMIAEFLSGAQAAFNTAAYHSGDIKPSTLADFNKGLEHLEYILESHDTKFLFGNEPGLVDYSIWPFLERFETLPVLGRTEFAIDKKKYILLASYMDNMKALPGLKAFYIPPALHVKFMDSKMKGNADYDLLTRH